MAWSSGSLSKIDKIIEAWKCGEEKRYSGYNVFAEGQAIYSYGYHFPMVVKNPSGLVVGNGDRYSVTTSNHQSHVRHLVDVLVPFSGLETLGIDPFKDSIECIHRESDGYRTMIGMRKNDEGEMEEYEYEQHFLGGSVLRVSQQVMVEPESEYGAGDGKYKNVVTYYVAAWDETGTGWQGSFFMSEMPSGKIPRTVDEALHFLKPQEVISWERFNDGKVLRQGEWFFVPAELPDACADAEKVEVFDKWVAPDPEKRWDKIQSYKKIYLLPLEDGGTGHHQVTYMKLSPTGTMYVSGTVRHTEGQHKMLRLDTSGKASKQWFIPYRNTAVRSVSMGGDVD